LKIIEEKNEIIIKQNMELQKLKRDVKLYEGSAFDKMKNHSDGEN